MGDVVSLTPSQEAVDAAWERHCSYATAVIAEPKLLLDREFVQDAARAEQQFRSSFLRLDAANQRGAPQGS